MSEDGRHPVATDGVVGPSPAAVDPMGVCSLTSVRPAGGGLPFRGSADATVRADGQGAQPALGGTVKSAILRLNNPEHMKVYQLVLQGSVNKGLTIIDRDKHWDPEAGTVIVHLTWIELFTYLRQPRHWPPH